MNELKPCPFCGSRNIKMDKCSKRVRCANCYATSGLIAKFRKENMTDDEAAICAWNTREDYAENDGRREAGDH